MVQELLELKSKVDKIIESSFANVGKFHDMVRVSNNNNTCTSMLVFLNE